MPYVIKHKQLGLFSTFVFDGVRGVNSVPTPIFTKDHDNQYVVKYVTGFKNIVIANELRRLLSENAGFSEDDFTIMEIKMETFDKAVSYKDVLDNGLASDAGYMIDSVPMISTAVH